LTAFQLEFSQIDDASTNPSRKEGRNMKYFLSAICLIAMVVLTVPIAQGEGETAMITAGKTVKFDYTLTSDGEKIESSEKNAPLTYVHGQGQIIKGLEKEMEGLKVGESKTITVSPEEGYGQIDPAAFREVPKSELPSGLSPKAGEMLSLKSSDGTYFPVIVSEVHEDSIVLNLNHPLAGKELVFEVTIVDIQ
jgi:FKBP-type peptidyl-prolyl cis-trans isomerase SlyD